MNSLLALVFLAEVAFVAPPSPPALARPDSEIFHAEQLHYETQLRRICLSGPGIRIATQSWRAKRVRESDRQPSWHQLEIDVASAAYADPVDMKRLEAALQAKATARANEELAQAENGIAVLRQLSPSDRVIYARRFTWMQPATPAQAC